MSVVRGVFCRFRKGDVVENNKKTRMKYISFICVFGIKSVPLRELNESNFSRKTEE